MRKTIDRDYWVCDECAPIIANGDPTHLDYHYDPETAKKRMDEIQAGLDRTPGVVSIDPDRPEDEFSRRPCDCCGTKMAGRRIPCVVYTKGPYDGWDLVDAVADPAGNGYERVVGFFNTPERNMHEAVLVAKTRRRYGWVAWHSEKIKSNSPSVQPALYATLHSSRTLAEKSAKGYGTDDRVLRVVEIQRKENA